MSTILDALRRAQKTEDGTAGGESDGQDSQRSDSRRGAPAAVSESSPKRPKSGAPIASGATGSRFDPPATVARDERSEPFDPTDSAGFADDPPGRASIAERLRALPIPPQLADWRVAAVIVGGLVIGLVLSSLSSDEEPASLELPDKVAQKLTAVETESPAQVTPPAVDRNKVAKQGKMQKAPKPSAVGDAPAPQPGPATESPPTPASPPAPASATPPAPAAMAGKPNRAKPANTMAPAAGQAAAAKPDSPAPAPMAPVGGPTGPLAPGAPIAAVPPAPTAAKPAPPPMPAPPLQQPAASGLAVQETGDDPEAVEQAAGAADESAPAAGEEFKVELLDNPPDGAPQIDLLFIRWKPRPADRVASIRTGGQRIVVLRENDIIEGMKVSRIEQSGIEFQWRGQRFMVLAARY